MLYPIMLEPIYKEMLWGGVKLNQLYARELPFSHTGESWDISCRKDEMGIVANGEYKGQRFIDVLETQKEQFLGTKLYENKDFPLLVKLIDANDNLSVQVHPNDQYAREKENEIYGKTEMWYILDAPENGYLIIGLKDGVTKESFKAAIDNGTAEECLGKLYVKKGDVINIPSGLLHAIVKGIVLAEVQQNSDITYRIYDYNRIGLDGTPRQLHIEKGLDVIDFDGKIKKEITPGLVISKETNSFTYYIANEYFAIIVYDIDSRYADQADTERFFTFTCLEGHCEIQSKDGTLELKTGDSCFIPAALGEFNIVGHCKLLKSFVPNMEKNFINILLDAGYTREDIKERTSVGL